MTNEWQKLQWEGIKFVSIFRDKTTEYVIKILCACENVFFSLDFPESCNHIVSEAVVYICVFFNINCYLIYRK